MTALRPASGEGGVLRGRQAEAEALAGLLRSAVDAAGGAVVVHGEAGAGKSALLDHALGQVRLRVLRVDGAEFEMGFPYAGLHQLCAPVLGLRARLPEPQRAALESVFGLRHDTATPFLVTLAVLALLVEASEADPVVCVVEDAQWVDAASMQALVFAARRVDAERIALVFVVRDPESVAQLAGLPRLQVGPLDDTAARALLETEVGRPLDVDVCNQIVAEARGNPLALLELSRDVGPAGLAGGWGGLAGRPLTGVLEERFAARAAALPDQARTLLVLAAAEPLGDPGLLRRSAAALGVALEAEQTLEDEGLLTVGPRIRFRHPLVRSAAYRAASPTQRRRAHAALALATDGETEPDRRVWHRAQATVDAAEDLADELERSAARAQSRGGLAAAAAFLQRSAELSPDSAERTRRTLAAATTALQAGAPTAALDLLGTVTALDGPERASADLLRAQVAFHLRRDADATAALLQAAGEQGPELARETYLEAFSATRFLDRLPGRLQALAGQVRAVVPHRTPPRPVDLLLDALIDQASRPAAEAVRSMQRAAAAFRDDSSGDPRWLDTVCQLAVDLYDDRTLRLLSDRQVHLARRQGALALLPQALNMQALAHLVAGDLRAALGTVTEIRTTEATTGSAGLGLGDVVGSAWRGDRAHLDLVFDTLRARAGEQEVTAELYARTVLGNGLGDYDAALASALRAVEQGRQGSYVVWQLGPELVEAAVRAGQPEAARDSLPQIVQRARASGTDWAIGVELQCRALLADDADAGALYEEAVDRLARSGATAVLARSRLLYGEWLRRRGRRVEARDQLRPAHAALSAMAADGFAARAEQELLATGEHPRKRSDDLRNALTAQELTIARLVAASATSKQVAAELFLSPRTIDAHLRNIFPKLNVTSRRQLRDLPL